MNDATHDEIICNIILFTDFSNDFLIWNSPASLIICQGRTGDAYLLCKSGLRQVSPQEADSAPDSTSFMHRLCLLSAHNLCIHVAVVYYCHGCQRMSKTADQVREEFRERGVAFTEWAKQNGFPLSAVNAVLIGHNKGYRGQSHKIAVALGMKVPPKP